MMDLLEDRYKRTSPPTAFCFFIIYLEQIDSMLLWVFPVKDHRQH